MSIIDKFRRSTALVPAAKTIESYAMRMEQKENPIGKVLYMALKVFASPYRQGNFIKAGSKLNPTVYGCVNGISDNCGSIPIKLVRIKKDGIEEEVVKHPILDLLRRPNLLETQREFIKRNIAQFLNVGENFLIANMDKNPTELWRCHADMVTLEMAASGVPMQYTIGLASKIDFRFNPLNGDCQVFHFMNQDPERPERGIPPLYAGRMWVDVGNLGAAWNAALLQNGARPSGAIKVKDATLTKDQRADLKVSLQENQAGADKAGMPLVLDKDMEWVEMGLSQKDMEFMKSLNYSDQAICTIYKYPFVLLSPDASTYANMATAREVLWQDCIMPLFDQWLEKLEAWLLPKFSGTDGLRLVGDYDNVPALEGVRQKKHDRITSLFDKKLITRNEARQELEYDKLPDGLGDKIMVNSGEIPLDEAEEGVDVSNDTTFEGDPNKEAENALKDPKEPNKEDPANVDDPKPEA